MRKTESLFEGLWPSTPEFASLAQAWAQRMTDIIVGLVWEGIDLMVAELVEVDLERRPVQIERHLGFLLHNRIAEIRDPALPFIVVHEPPEFEELKTPQARPPQPDLGFVFSGNDRVIWPVEMKVLHSERDVRAYAEEVRGNFLTFRYAPFTGAGALLGFLLKGQPQVAFRNISQAIPCTMRPGSFNPPRHHMVSEHMRVVPPGKAYAPLFRCHHLLLLVTASPALVHDTVDVGDV